MDFKRRAEEPGLICTCSDLHKEEIQASIDLGWQDSVDVMYDLGTQFRCEVCRPIIDRMIERNGKTDKE